MRNIELKSRLLDLAAARQVARGLEAVETGTLRQTDTYFLCVHGRLKLRETDGHAPQLVWYRRPDQPRPKGSDYHLVAVADPAALKAALCGALGLRGVVQKTRELFLLDNVRIHLDQVDGLGAFLEFEAVLDETHDEAHGHQQLDRLSHAFGLRPHDLLAQSYSDLLGI